MFPIFEPAWLRSPISNGVSTEIVPVDHFVAHVVAHKTVFPANVIIGRDKHIRAREDNLFIGIGIWVKSFLFHSKNIDLVCINEYMKYIYI